MNSTGRGVKRSADRPCQQETLAKRTNQRGTTAESSIPQFGRDDASSVPLWQQQLLPSPDHVGDTDADYDNKISCQSSHLSPVTVQRPENDRSEQLFVPVSGDSVLSPGNSNANSSQDLVCCGMVCVARRIQISYMKQLTSSKIHELPCRIVKDANSIHSQMLEEALLDDRHVRLELAYHTDRCQLLMPGSVPVGDLKTSFAEALANLRIFTTVQLTPYVDVSKFTAALGTDGSAQPAQRVLLVSVNVVCESSELTAIGLKLSDHGIYLQDPDWKGSDHVYSNPHVLTFNGISEADLWLEEMTLASLQRHSSSEVEDWGLVLDHLPQYQALAADIDEARLSVPLLNHQLDAVSFMIRREIGDLDETLKYWHIASNDDGATVYKHIVTRDESATLPWEPRSGILADHMGLGKTFTTLAVISSSIRRAGAFASSHQFSTQIWARSKATLIVLPSELIMKQWITEIEEKLEPGSVRFSIYHGQDRARHYTELIEYDIVLTTYGTVAKEHCRSRAREILYRIEWFRLVLDEAHVVRSQRTRQFNAIQSLQAIHHWCLTGTPISNKVDDLGALVSICRVPLLEDRSKFREHIVKTTRRSFRAGCSVLQKTLEPLCLRRTKHLLNLPQPTLVSYTVQFSRSEQDHYNNAMKQCRRSLDDAVSGRQGLRHSMLQAILQLRIFCNLGTHSTFARPCAEDGLDPDEALALLQQKDKAQCSGCSREVLVINQPDDSDSGVLATCSHVLCRLCFDNVSEAVNTGMFLCPECSNSVKQVQLQPWQSLAEPASTSENHSSKLNRLMMDLLETKIEHKSLVLSCWKKTIDLVSTLCASQGIECVRIDGTVPQPERQAALEKFIHGSKVSALLMTMGTGALGLNLTAATRVHILEPQWNPAVEEQAIGRLVRIGQKKNITVLRYLVEASIEERIQVYQRRKIQLIAGGFGDSSESSIEAQTRLLTHTFFSQHAA